MRGCVGSRPRPRRRRAYKPWIAMAATHITTEAAINTNSGLSVDLPVFATTIPDSRSKDFIPSYAMPGCGAKTIGRFYGTRQREVHCDVRPKTDISQPGWHVRFVPKADIPSN
jgi:hypothetical protein